MEKRFTALRTIGYVYKGLAWAVLILGGIPALLSLLIGIAGGTRAPGLLGPFGGPALGAIGAALIFAVTVLMFVGLYGAGEAAFLALAVEENTRATAAAVQELVRAQSQAIRATAPGG